MKKILLLLAAILFTLGIFIFRVHAALYPAMPKSIKVGPFIYTVEENNALASESKLGMMNCDKLEIFIQAGLPLSKQREVLFHELDHTSFCVPSILTPEAEPKFTQEETVYLSAPQMVMILRDNPDLVNFLTGK